MCRRFDVDGRRRLVGRLRTSLPKSRHAAPFSTSWLPEVRGAVTYDGADVHDRYADGRQHVFIAITAPTSSGYHDAHL